MFVRFVGKWVVSEEYYYRRKRFQNVIAEIDIKLESAASNQNSHFCKNRVPLNDVWISKIQLAQGNYFWCFVLFNLLVVWSHSKKHLQFNMFNKKSFLKNT